MQSSSSLHFPSTPVSSHHQKFASTGPSYRPYNSSPLASPSTPEQSPEVAARRRAQFKSKTPSTPVPTSSRSYLHTRSISSSGGSVFGGAGATPIAEDPQKAFLREKFKARCLERAAKARAKVIRGKRYLSEASSDGFDEAMDDDDDEEDDDAIMHDELFRRIIENANRRDRHSFRVSYSHEVGSSFDPDVENLDEWEHDLIASGQSSQASSSQPPDEPTSVDLDDEELEAYAEECARRAAMADFEDIPQDELFSLSDVEELVESRDHEHGGTDEDVEMMH